MKLPQAENTTSLLMHLFSVSQKVWWGGGFCGTPLGP